MNPEGVPIPAQPAPEDAASLKAEIQRLSRQLLSERQAAAQTLASERAKCKAEMDKLRESTFQHRRDLENQNQALLQSLGRMKADYDELQKRIYQLEARGAQEVQRTVAEPSSPTVPVQIQQPPALSGGAIPPKQS